MTASSKEIRVDQLKSVKTRLNAWTTSSHAVGESVDDTSKQKLIDCVLLIQDCGANLEKSVENLDAYLNAVATAFKNTDTVLATKIQGVTTKSMRVVKSERIAAEKKATKDQKEKVKRSQSYSKLPS